MFLNKNKLDENLKYYINNDSYRFYRVLIKYKNFQSSLLKKINSYHGTIFYTLDSINIISAQLNKRGLMRIIEYPEIEKIYLDEYLFLCGMSVSTANKVHLSSAYSLSGEGIGIGLVDSGVFPHPDLLSPSNKIEMFVDLINDIKYPYDDNGHGTATAGILCSSGISSNNMYKGICHKSKLFCFKAFDKLGKGFASTVLYAINSLIDISEENNIKLLCLPFELLTHNIFIISCFKSIFNYAISKGVIPIVPSGSNYNDKYSIMGISVLPNCITVSGVNTSTNTIKPYSYSASGPYAKMNKPDLAAACVNIYSLNSDANYISEKNGLKLYPRKLDTPYKSFSGTSLSAAYICGICALLFQKNPDYKFNDIVSLLKVGCTPIDEIPKYIQGEGLINIKNLPIK